MKLYTEEKVKNNAKNLPVRSKNQEGKELKLRSDISLIGLLIIDFVILLNFVI